MFCSWNRAIPIAVAQQSLFFGLQFCSICPQKIQIFGSPSSWEMALHQRGFAVNISGNVYDLILAGPCQTEQAFNWTSRVLQQRMMSQPYGIFVLLTSTAFGQENERQVRLFRQLKPLAIGRIPLGFEIEEVEYTDEAPNFSVFVFGAVPSTHPVVLYDLPELRTSDRHLSNEVQKIRCGEHFRCCQCKKMTIRSFIRQSRCQVCIEHNRNRRIRRKDPKIPQIQSFESFEFPSLKDNHEPTHPYQTKSHSQ